MMLFCTKNVKGLHNFELACPKKKKKRKRKKEGLLAIWQPSGPVLAFLHC